MLPPNLLRSPNYTVGNQVGLDNFQYVFRVDTEWGPFTIKGSDLLRVRAREIAATAEIEQIGGAGTLVNAAGRTALKPLATAKDLVTAPGKTIGDTFKGVGNMFGSVDASMAATDPNKEKLIPSLDRRRHRPAQARLRFRRRSQHPLSAARRRADPARHRQRHRRDHHQCRACLRHRRRRHRHQRRRHQPHAAAGAARQDGRPAREGGPAIAGVDGRSGRDDGCVLRQSQSLADRQGDHRRRADEYWARPRAARSSSPARPTPKATRWASSTAARPS